MGTDDATGGAAAFSLECRGGGVVDVQAPVAMTSDIVTATVRPEQPTISRLHLPAKTHGIRPAVATFT